MKPVLALDADGVLVDFVTPAIEYLNARGVKKTYSQVTDWCVFDSNEELEEAYKREVVAHPDFCRSMKAYPGAAEFVRAAKECYDVVVVTAPYNVPNWYEGRRDWMEKNMGIPHKDVCFLSRKEFFDADILVDDKTENVVSWVKRQDDRRAPYANNSLPILMDQPWNRHDIVACHGIKRVSSWRTLAVTLEERGFPAIRGNF